MRRVELAELLTQLNTLLDLGCVLPSLSPYKYPILFAEKKVGGGLRMCIGYRTLNSNTLTDSLPLPYMDILLACLYRTKFFSKLNLYNGYHHIPTHLSDCYKMAFACYYGSTEFVVMLFEECTIAISANN